MYSKDGDIRQRNLCNNFIPLFSDIMISTKIEPCAKTTTNKKVPGEVLPIGKLEDEAKKFENEITKKTTPELQDLLERQNRIFLNAKLIQALPDKGAKVRLRRQQLMVSRVESIILGGGFGMALVLFYYTKL